MIQCCGFVDGMQPLKFNFWNFIKSSVFDSKEEICCDSHEVVNV